MIIKAGPVDRRGRRAEPLPGELRSLGHRPVARRNDRVRDQPGQGPGAETGACNSANLLILPILLLIGYQAERNYHVVIFPRSSS